MCRTDHYQQELHTLTLFATAEEQTNLREHHDLNIANKLHDNHLNQNRKVELVHVIPPKSSV